MNANELADLIGLCGDGGYNQDAATMLRQQQAEIGALKQIIDANNLSQNIGQFVKPTNEPVAWARQDGVIAFHKKPEVDSQGFKWFPLYTHPVKEQDESFDRTASHMAGEYVSYKAELTDEEIRTIQAICHLKNVGYDNFIMRFARAILRKAQEKWA